MGFGVGLVVKWMDVENVAPKTFVKEHLPAVVVHSWLLLIVEATTGHLIVGVEFRWQESFHPMHSETPCCFHSHSNQHFPSPLLEPPLCLHFSTLDE